MSSRRQQLSTRLATKPGARTTTRHPASEQLQELHSRASTRAVKSAFTG